MAIYQLGDKKPVIPASCYISEEATIIGSVVLVLKKKAARRALAPVPPEA